MPPRLPRRIVAALLSTVLAVGTTVAVTSTASAQEPPAPGPGPVLNPSPEHVTGDALPTVQIDGVVWAQEVVGNTVFVGGEFTNARPAGAAPGTQLVPRQNLLAYNLTTGELIRSFDLPVNAVVRDIAASPDGSRIYIAGSFSSVGGVSRQRVAAIDTATGQVITSFFPRPFSTVKALVATDDAVYLGGPFTVIDGQPRNRLAAVTASSGALTAWNPSADGTVNALVATPDGSSIIAGGAFANVSNAPAYGMTSLDATTGAVGAWEANETVRDAGPKSAILSLRSDGTTIYGTGYVFGKGGNFEGTFAAEPDSGKVVWLEDCHGDTYDVFPVNGVVYTAGHAHYCSPVGGFDQTEPWTINQRRALSFTADVTGTLGRNIYPQYEDFSGQPASSLYNWFPDLAVGDYTGATQAAWSVAGNDDYVVMGGEFPRVNGKVQQGLVRFATKPTAPGKVGPRLTGAQVPLTAEALPTGGVTIGWTANDDRDDLTLTYKLVRDGRTNAPVFTTEADSPFWAPPELGFTDETTAPDTTYAYRLYTSDADGNTSVSDSVRITTPPAAAALAYDQTVVGDDAQTYWRLDEAGGSVAKDTVGRNDADQRTGITHGVPGALADNTAAGFDGSPNGSMSTKTPVPAPDAFSTEAWIKTETTRGGKIIGFGSERLGLSGSNDRSTYMDDAGHLTFGVYPNRIRTVTSPQTYNDGRWHHVVSTLGPNGMTLSVDGVQVASRADTTSGYRYSGYWRVGGGNLTNWPQAPASPFIEGIIDEVALYPAALTRAQVAAHFSAAGDTDGPVVLDNEAPEAAFTATVDGLAVTVDGTTSTDADGTVESYEWDFGDGSTEDGPTPSHTYAEAGTYDVTLTVTDDKGDTGTITRPVTVTAPDNPDPDNVAPEAAFIETVDGLSVTVDGTSSTDADGTVESYEWDFGDGTTENGPTPSHTYAADGTYDVTLTVTDDEGATGTVARPVTVAVPVVNAAPTAEFTTASEGLTISTDGSASADLDGAVTAYAWDFGDGTTAEGPTAEHTYAGEGTYDVTLTVTDDQGATDVLTQSVTVEAVPPDNVPPTAVFTSSVDGLTVAVDGSGSTDPDGTVADVAWDFGDETGEVGPTASHTYAEAGTYTVTVTVTDDKGASSTQSEMVTVEGPGNEPAVFGADSFDRDTANGLGTADVGGAWTAVGPSSWFSTAGGTGDLRMTGPGAGPAAFLNEVSAADVNIETDVSLAKAPTGAGTYVSLAARRVGGNDYRLVTIVGPSSTTLKLTRTIDGVTTTIGQQRVDGAPNGVDGAMRVRFQVSGATLAGKVWSAAGGEPADWQVTATDSALGAPGGVGVMSYLSGSATNAPQVTSFDGFRAVAGP